MSKCIPFERGSLAASKQLVLDQRDFGYRLDDQCVYDQIKHQKREPVINLMHGVASKQIIFIFTRIPVGLWRFPDSLFKDHTHVIHNGC